MDTKTTAAITGLNMSFFGGPDAEDGQPQTVMTWAFLHKEFPPGKVTVIYICTTASNYQIHLFCFQHYYKPLKADAG